MTHEHKKTTYVEIRRKKIHGLLGPLAKLHSIKSRRAFSNILLCQWTLNAGPLLAKCVPKQDFIVVPPPSNIMEVLKTTYHRGQNRTLIKYKSK